MTQVSTFFSPSSAHVAEMQQGKEMLFCSWQDKISVGFEIKFKRGASEHIGICPMDVILSFWEEKYGGLDAV